MSKSVWKKSRHCYNHIGNKCSIKPVFKFTGDIIGYKCVFFKGDFIREVSHVTDEVMTAKEAKKYALENMLEFTDLNLFERKES